MFGCLDNDHLNGDGMRHALSIGLCVWHVRVVCVSVCGLATLLDRGLWVMGLVIL